MRYRGWVGSSSPLVVENAVQLEVRSVALLIVLVGTGCSSDTVGALFADRDASSPDAAEPEPEDVAVADSLDDAPSDAASSGDAEVSGDGGGADASSRDGDVEDGRGGDVEPSDGDIGDVGDAADDDDGRSDADAEDVTSVDTDATAGDAGGADTVGDVATDAGDTGVADAGGGDAVGDADGDSDGGGECPELEIDGFLPGGGTTGSSFEVTAREVATSCGECPYSAVVTWSSSGGGNFAICDEDASRIVVLEQPPTTCNTASGARTCGGSAPALPADGETFYFVLCRNSPGRVNIEWLPEAMADRC